MGVHGNMPSLIAGGNINPSVFVKGGAADHTVIQADADATTVLGVSGPGTKAWPETGNSTVHAAAGDPVELHGFGDEALLKIGTGGITRFAYLKAEADGEGVAATSGDVANAMALESAAAGELGRVLVISPFQVP